MQSISTNVVKASLVMYFCTDFILMKLVIAFCTFRNICDLNLRVLSRTPPRYLTLLLNSMRSGPAFNGSCAALLSCCFDPNNMYSNLWHISQKTEILFESRDAYAKSSRQLPLV